jgi:hypothetical protein
MTPQEKQKLFANEIESCVDLINQTWNVPIFRNQKNEVVDLERVIVAIFEHAQESAKYLADRFACQPEFRAITQARREHLAAISTPENPADYFYDGIEDALSHFSDSIQKMHEKLHLSLSERQDPVLDRVKSDFTGFKECTPREFTKYLQLYEADYDVAYDFSMKKMAQSIGDFKGMSSKYLLSNSLPELNSQFNLTENLRKGRDLTHQFISNVFRHAMAVQQYCNIQEIKAELNQIDPKAPFINELVVLNTPWAALTSKHNPKQQKAPAKLQSKAAELSDVQQKVLLQPLSKEEKLKAMQDKKEKDKALIASIYGTPNP